MIQISSSELLIGSSLSLLPTKCQKWWSHIYLSIWIWLDGQLSINLKIDNNQTYYSISEKQLHQIQEANQSKWDTVPSKINWETGVNDLWLIWRVVIRAAKWYITASMFIWNREGKVSIQGVLQLERGGRMIVCLCLNTCSEICSIRWTLWMVFKKRISFGEPE